jgi:hypothetical protein
MKPRECEFESEAWAAALGYRWPERVDADLRAHVATCAICSDVITIAVSIEDARQEMHAAALVPDPGRVWWLAQLRAGREAAQAVGRPITAAQVIAVACAVGVLGACFGATSKWFQSALGWIASSLGTFDVKTLFPSATALLAGHGALILALAVVLFLVPTAVYLALGRD